MEPILFCVLLVVPEQSLGDNVNPLTEEYRTMKSTVLSDSFSWYTHSTGCDDFQFFCHVVVGRPERNNMKLPTIQSDMAPLCSEVVSQLCEANGKQIECIYRMAFNLVPVYKNSPLTSNNHVDHEFPHTNLVVHLTDAGGATIVEGSRLEAEEDEAVFFQGKHCMEFPTSKNRVVFVATFLEREGN